MLEVNEEPVFQQLPKIGEFPAARSGHCMFRWRDSIFVFGGLQDAENREDFGIPCSELYAFSLTEAVWRRVPTKGATPNVFGHAVVVCDSKLVSFGGQEQAQCTTGATTVLDLDTSKSLAFTWQELEGVRPPSRWGHSMVLCDQTNSTRTHPVALLFGGMSYKEGSFHDLWELDLEKLTWRQIFATSTLPLPRRRHASWVWENWMYVFGGRHHAQYFNDLWRLNLSSLEWEEVQKSTDKADPSIFKFLSGDTTLCPKIRNALASYPSPRTGHTATLDKDRVYIHGGFCFAHSDGNNMVYRLFNDLYELNLNTHTWRAIIADTPCANPTAPQLGSWRVHPEEGSGIASKRSMAACIVVDGHLILTGGRDHDGAIASFMFLPLRATCNSLFGFVCRYILRSGIDVSAQGIPRALVDSLAPRWITCQ
eukprot:TRINITY_DN18467_c0_g1_i1.p1 TRINITY_DN18467_c0_g1~~TRINITY_DN18467_c0_g1_i1.p1  ORF type:complete len:424 (+),score=39.15 TRINITY_DN18467_c0_g1_i1:42-1313(+)